MIEVGKCYYNKRVIVKILEIMEDRYYVRGFDTLACTYYQCAIMSKNNQLIETFTTDETGKNKSNIVIIANQLEFRQRIKKIDNAIEQKNAASNEDISDLVEAASANAREQSEDSIPVF